MVGEAAYERMNWFLVKLCLVLISFSWSALQPQCNARFDEFKLPILPIFYKNILRVQNFNKRQLPARREANLLFMCEKDEFNILHDVGGRENYNI